MKKTMKRIACLIVAISLITIVASADKNQTNIINVSHPVIKIKALKDTINDTDGTIEIYVENPWTHGLNVDISASGPPELYFFSEIFQTGMRTGVAGGNFVVSPGQKRTVLIYVRADKIGKYQVKINGEYYTEAYSIENIASQQIHSRQMFTVVGKNPNIPKTGYTASGLFSSIYDKAIQILQTI